MIDMWWSVGLSVIAGLAVVSLTHYWYRWSNPKCNGKLPPGSMGFPLIGETIQFFIGGSMYSVDIPPFIKKRIARYGTLFRTSLVGRPVVMSSDPEFNHFILQKEDKLIELWYMDAFSAIIGTVANATSTAHILKYLKNLFLNHFGIERLKENQMMNKMEVMAHQYLQSWSTQPSVQVKESIASMVFDLTSLQLLTYDSNKYSSSKDMSKMLANFLDGVMSLPLNIPGTVFHRCMKDREKLLNMIKEIINEKITSPEKRLGDFLDQLLNDREKEEGVMKECLTEEFLVSLMFGLLLASVETISLTLNVVMMLLSDHPLVLKELMEEHEEILKSRENVDSPITWKEYKSMTFTTKVINETLRVSSVAPGILRKAIKDIHVNGYVIPKGWTIMVLHSAIHKNPANFEDPLAFNPWRWKDLGSNTQAKNFFPFGGGIRHCVGAEFAKVFMSLFLHVLVTKFSWTKMKGGGDATGILAVSPRNDFHVKICQKNDIKAHSS
ncbi:Cytochrome P450 [Macleaya cordata]|uniref:Cytochrome P450 n=1 Tax=Macleaya cordata TaxID=56857 RepID=A0A200Q526_MACCD|nr:Cytochrome P450 [Macleaya cordata]